MKLNKWNLTKGGDLLELFATSKVIQSFKREKLFKNLCTSPSVKRYLRYNCNERSLNFLSTNSHLLLASQMVPEATWKKSAPTVLFQRGRGKSGNRHVKFDRKLILLQQGRKRPCSWRFHRNGEMIVAGVKPSRAVSKVQMVSKEKTHWV